MEAKNSELQKVLGRLVALEQKVKELEGVKAKAYLSVDETCEYLDCSREYIYKLMQWGHFNVSKPGKKKVYIERDSIDKWLESGISY